MFKEILARLFQEMQIPCTPEMLEKLYVYYTMLVDWNTRMNLTAIIEPQEAAQKHFADSASAVVQGCIPANALCMDVGTGAGFPGMVIAILRPDVQMVLLDALQKRLTFLDAVVEALQLPNVRTVHGRAEDAAHAVQHRQNYDVVFARAVGNLNVLAEYCMPFLKTGGQFIAYKGKLDDGELQEAQFALKILGGGTPEVKDAMVPALSHCLVIVKKIGGTPKAYPRKAGKPAKDPIKKA